MKRSIRKMSDSNNNDGVLVQSATLAHTPWCSGAANILRRKRSRLLGWCSRGSEAPPPPPAPARCTPRPRRYREPSAPSTFNLLTVVAVILIACLWLTLKIYIETTPPLTELVGCAAAECGGCGACAGRGARLAAAATLLRADHAHALWKMRIVKRCSGSRLMADAPGGGGASHTLPVDNGGVRRSGAVACGVSARGGAGTAAWSARAALWGVLPVPLYRASPSPRLLLQPSPARPADCWPFRGARGEVIIEASRLTRVTLLSLEHVRPDTTRSAPARFTLYGILANGTRRSGYSGEYRAGGAARQLFRSGLAAAPVRAVALRVHTNHGNPRYTCLYRVQIYTPAALQP